MARANEEPKTDDSVVSLTTVTLDVKRDPMTTIRKTVYLHELPLVAYIHGPDAISEVIRDSVKVANFNPGAEADRMRSLYNTKTDNYMEKVFGLDAAEKIAKIHNLEVDRHRPHTPQQSISKVRDRGDKVRVA